MNGFIWGHGMSKATSHRRRRKLSSSELSEVALIALGSNLSNPLAQLQQARHELAAISDIVALSSIYQSRLANQADMLSAVIAMRIIEGLSTPEMLVESFQQIELWQGREIRAPRDARPLDLDLLTFADDITSSDIVTIPHPRMMERPFILAPLCEIAPEWQHPFLDMRPCQTLRNLETSHLVRTNFRWDVTAPL